MNKALKTSSRRFYKRFNSIRALRLFIARCRVCSTLAQGIHSINAIASQKTNSPKDEITKRIAISDCYLNAQKSILRIMKNVY